MPLNFAFEAVPRPESAVIDPPRAPRITILEPPSPPPLTIVEPPARPQLPRDSRFRNSPFQVSNTSTSSPQNSHEHILRDASRVSQPATPSSQSSIQPYSTPLIQLIEDLVHPVVTDYMCGQTPFATLRSQVDTIKVEHMQRLIDAMPDEWDADK